MHRVINSRRSDEGGHGSNSEAGYQELKGRASLGIGYSGSFRAELHLNMAQARVK
jgi:hypothetical protein